MEGEEETCSRVLETSPRAIIRNLPCSLCLVLVLPACSCVCGVWMGMGSGRGRGQYYERRNAALPPQQKKQRRPLASSSCLGELCNQGEGQVNQCAAICATLTHAPCCARIGSIIVVLTFLSHSHPRTATSSALPHSQAAKTCVTSPSSSRSTMSTTATTAAVTLLRASRRRCPSSTSQFTQRFLASSPATGSAGRVSSTRTLTPPSLPSSLPSLLRVAPCPCTCMPFPLVHPCHQRGKPAAFLYPPAVLTPVCFHSPSLPPSLPPSLASIGRRRAPRLGNDPRHEAKQPPGGFGMLGLCRLCLHVLDSEAEGGG